MMTQHNQLVEDYLERLDQAARRLPEDRRIDLLSSVREHITVALDESGPGGEAEVRQVLGKLGSPEEIVSAALADDEPKPAPVVRSLADPTGFGNAGDQWRGAVMTLAMSAAEREAFLADVHVGVLSVAGGADRAPLALPVWYLYEPGGEIAFITGRDSRKMALVREAGRVSLVVQDPTPPYRYASVEGSVVSIEDPARQEDRRTLAERYLGVEGGAQYLESTKDVADTMVMFRVRPERWYTRDYRKQSA
jgi:PPOX class probable F420-dependent enzyme